MKRDDNIKKYSKFHLDNIEYSLYDIIKNSNMLLRGGSYGRGKEG